MLVGCVDAADILVEWPVLGAIPGIEDPLEGVLHVSAGKGCAVVEGDVVTQREREARAILRKLPGGGEARFEVEVAAEDHEGLHDHGDPFEGGYVGGDSGVERGDLCPGSDYQRVVLGEDATKAKECQCQHQGCKPGSIFLHFRDLLLQYLSGGATAQPSGRG